MRSFQRGDVPAVARLFTRVFQNEPNASNPGLERFLETVFFGAPISACPSYIYEDDRGDIGGFLGVHPRTFMVDGQSVAAAAWGQFMVAPELRGRGIAVQLAEQFYRGDHDFSFSGSANTAARAVNRRLGGINPGLMGLSWRKTLRSARVFRRRVEQALRGRGLSKAASILAPGAVVRPTLPSLFDELNLSDVQTVYERAFADVRIHPRFDAEQLAWKLRLASTSHRPGTMAHVFKDGAEPIGWVVWFLEKDANANVVQLLCVPGDHDTVVKQLFAQARAAGAETIGGLCGDQASMLAVQSAGAAVKQTPSTFIFHSSDANLLAELHSATPHTSLFDGEGWIDFPRPDTG